MVNAAYLPTVISGCLVISLTAAEMQIETILAKIVDQTATKVWMDDQVNAETYGDASSKHPNIGIQTGDSFDRIGSTGSGLSSSATASAVSGLNDFDPASDLVWLTSQMEHSS